jgi:L-fuculose-phosphate aldolase
MSTTNDRAKRQSIIDACWEMNWLGINISPRHEDRMLITPTSTPYEL